MYKTARIIQVFKSSSTDKICDLSYIYLEKKKKNFVKKLVKEETFRIYEGQEGVTCEQGLRLPYPTSFEEHT